MLNPYVTPRFWGREDDPRELDYDVNLELSRLRERLLAARDRGEGAFLRVSGAVGVGKTRLLEEFERRARLEKGCDAVSVSVLECGLTSPTTTLIRTLARRLLERDPEWTGAAVAAAAKRRRKTTANAVAATAISAGASAAFTGALPVVLAGLGLMAGGVALQALLAIPDATPGSPGAPVAAIPDLCDAIVKLNEFLGSQQPPRALAILIDQWDDILRLTKPPQDELRSVRDELARRLAGIPVANQRVVLAVGVREERARYCFPVQTGPFEEFTVTPLRPGVALDLILEPTPDATKRGFWFDEEAAQALVDQFCSLQAQRYPGDLAALLLVARHVCARAKKLPVSAEDLPQEIDEGIDGLVSEMAATFQVDHLDDEGARRFLDQLALAEHWDHLAPGEMAWACGPEVTPNRVRQWLVWWCAPDRLMAENREPVGTFRFRHESYHAALGRSLQGDLAQQLREARRACATAGDLLRQPTEDGMRAAVACVEGVPPYLRQARPDLVSQMEALLLGVLRNSTAPGTRAAVANAAEGLGGHGVDVLVAALDDRDGDVRKSAVQALGRVGDDRAVSALVTGLGDRASDVRAATQRALEDVGEAAFAPLVGALSDQNPTARQMAVEVLGRTSDARAIGPLTGALEDAYPVVRLAAVEALGLIGSPAALEPLLATLADPDVFVHHAAVRALRRASALTAKSAIAGLGDSEEGWWRAIGPAMGDIAYSRGLGALLAKLDHPEQQVQRLAASALGRIRDARAVEPLVAKLDDPHLGVRLEAASALVSIGGARAIESVAAELDDPDEDMRIGAAQALARVGDIRAVEPHIASLDHPDEETRRAAAKVLGQIGDRRAVEPLIAKLDDPAGGVRGTAAEALGQIGDTRAVAPLVTTLDDPNEEVRRTAAQVLGRIGDASAVDALVDKLNDDATMFWSAAEALGRIGSARAVTPLIARLGGYRGHLPPSASPPHPAAQALVWIGDAAVEPLIGLLHEESGTKGEWAAWALGQIGTRRALGAVRRYWNRGGPRRSERRSRAT